MPPSAKKGLQEQFRGALRHFGVDLRLFTKILSSGSLKKKFITKTLIEKKITVVGLVPHHEAYRVKKVSELDPWSSQSIAYWINNELYVANFSKTIQIKQEFLEKSMFIFVPFSLLILRFPSELTKTYTKTKIGFNDQAKFGFNL